MVQVLVMLLVLALVQVLVLVLALVWVGVQRVCRSELVVAVSALFDV